MFSANINSKQVFGNSTLWQLYGLAIITAGGVLAGCMSDTWMYVLAGPLALITWWAVVDPRKCYFLMWMTVPLSTAVEFGGVGTDLPCEPMMWMLTIVMGIMILRNPRIISKSYLMHPISLLLLLHFGWMCVTTFFAEHSLISVKFIAAKVWYIAVFYVMTPFFIKSAKDWHILYICVISTLMFAVGVIMWRHIQEGLAFKEISFILRPFFYNHVVYAAMLTTLVPWIWYQRKRWTFGGLEWLIGAGILLFFITAIYFSYTRAAYLALIAGIPIWIILRLRLIIPVYLGLFVLIGIGVHSIQKNNLYLQYAPDYNKTITHERFDDLIHATYKLQDISTMERVHRWVAAGFMVKDHPWLGVGPGNFYSTYKPYSVTAFRTYVSENKERSGIHNYYLLILVEQGIPGLLIYLAFILYALWRGQKLYSRLQNREHRQILVSCLLMLCTIHIFQLINDLLETDKVGTLFLLATSMIVVMESQWLGNGKKLQEQGKTPPLSTDPL